MPAIDWHPWSAEAFARARAERKPVLLSITASWCGCCDEMDRTSYADPDVAALVNGRFVAVRVDSDRRPDIGERYHLGGWPTTAFLTPDGAIVGGGTYVSREKLAGVLADVADAFVTRGSELVSLDASAAEGSCCPTHPSAVDDLVPGIFASFDSTYGGFGDAPKFPLTAPVHLALELYAERADAGFADLAVRTLDAMGSGGLYDDVDGGFFRCAGSRDWRDPQREKLLEVNAALLGLFLHAARVLGVARFAERAAGVLRYVQTRLADHDAGGWAGSEPATPSRFDAAFYADSNARMASAALEAAAAFGDDRLREFAVRSLERVVLACYRPGAGVAHYVLDGSADVRGLLDDQISMAAAHLDAHAATGDIVYEMMAEELAHHAVASLWDGTRGGFYDRLEEPDAVGLLRRRIKPFAGNCSAARMFRRLSVVSGNAEFGRIAEAAIGAVAPAAAAQGPLAAHLALAMREPSYR